METNIFQREPLDIKPSLLSTIIDEILREKEATRNKVTLAAGVGATSVRKVFSALNRCGFTDEICRPQANGAKPCGHLFLQEQASVLIFDLSAPIYRISLLGSNCQCVFCEQYVYDRRMNLYDNLISFFSRARLLIKRARIGFCSIGVICADKILSSPQAHDPALPTISQHKEYIDDLIRKIFGIAPTTYADLSDALRYAIHYNILPVSSANSNAAYIFLGSELYAVALPADGKPIPIKLSQLMPTSSTQLGERAQDFSSKNNVVNILWRTVNLLECMMHIDLLVVESDSEKFGVTALSRIRKTLSVMGRPEPDLRAHTKTPGVAAIGLSRACIASLILSHLTSDAPSAENEKI